MDKEERVSYEFFRGRPFQGIVKPWGRKVREIPELKPHFRKIIYNDSRQMELYPEEFYELGLRGKEARIYELLDYAIHGGIPKEQRRIAKGVNGEKNGIICEPDLIGLRECWAIDTKGVAPSRELKISDTQFAKYLIMQIGNYFPKPPKIRFDIFRHDISHLEASFENRDLEELVVELAENTRFGLFLPLSVIYHIHSLEKNHEFTSRSRSKKWDGYYTSFKPKGMDSLLAYPLETLEYLGLNPDDFSVERSKYPRGVKINDTFIRPFPITVIGDINPEKWLAKANNIDLNPHLEALEEGTKRRRKMSKHQEIIEVNSLKIPKEKIREYQRYKLSLADSPF